MGFEGLLGDQHLAAEGRIAVHKSLGKGVPLHIKVSFTVVCRINHMSEESFKNFGTQKSDAV